MSEVPLNVFTTDKPLLAGDTLKLTATISCSCDRCLADTFAYAQARAAPWWARWFVQARWWLMRRRAGRCVLFDALTTRAGVSSRGFADVVAMEHVEASVTRGDSTFPLNVDFKKMKFEEKDR